jgi:phage shock protein A
MTYRERRERRADRLRGWAEKRQTNATATLAAGEQYHGDVAFNTQPGHIPERARVIAREEKAFASLRKAQGMESRAAGIEDQLATAIYRDDPDAIQALEARIAKLEAERGRIKAYNASCRKGQQRDLSLLDEAQKADLLRILGVGMAGRNGAFPSYALTNLGGNIARNRERLAGMQTVA